MMICKAGTALGERTMAAMETCSDTAVAEGRARKGKGNGKKPKPNKGNGEICRGNLCVPRAGVDGQRYERDGGSDPSR